jgi:O-methyltransferase involved in polyketide biosynthesis
MDAMIAGLAPAQEVLFFPLKLRAVDSRAERPILGDSTSAELVERVDYDFDRWPTGRIMVAVHAARAKILDDAVRAFVARHADAVVLDLGCGLDPRVRRVDPPPGVDWYDVDLPEVVRLREQLLPGRSRTIAADLADPDLATTGWLDGVPGDRPAMIVCDGLMALLPGAAFTAMVRAVTGHFAAGELAFNVYHPIALRRPVFPGLPGLRPDTTGAGFVDPREPQGWGAGLTLVEELLHARLPTVAEYPQPWRAFARLTARATRFHRTGDRVVRYRF